MGATRTAKAMLSGWLAALTAVAIVAVAAPNAAGAVPGENLLENGSFETGEGLLSPWIFRHDVAATLAVENLDVVDGVRAAKVTVAATSTATHLVQLRQEGVQLQGATAYTVSFWAKASGTRVINSRLQSPVAPYPTLRAVEFTLSTTWQRFEFSYTAASDVPNAFVGFNLAQATGDVWLDGVILFAGNLVRNGGFETGGALLSPWIWRNDIDASLIQDTTVKFAGAASARITVPTVGAASHLAQLRTPVAPLDRGRGYVVEFAIKASRPRLANVRLQSSVAPYPTVAANNFNVTTDWTYVSFQWTPSANVNDLFVGFNLAQDTGTVWIDDVSLTGVPRGIITTVAGKGFGDGGPATNAIIHVPHSVAVDAAGNLYITDPTDHRVRKVSSAGTISTVAGNRAVGSSGDGGPATNATLNHPEGVAVDAAGNLYIADAFNHRVRKVTPVGTISTVAGNGTQGFSGDGGPATNARVNFPRGLALDAAGNLYIADRVNNRVRKVSPTGTISTVAGSGAEGFSGDGGPATLATLNQPVGVAVDAGSLYIADQGNLRVRRVSAAGTISTVAGNGERGSSGDGGPATDASLSLPTGVAVDAAGNLSISIPEMSRVRRVSPAGTITTIAGNGTPGFSGDAGPATNATLREPQGIAVNAAGDVYIADTGNARVRRVSSAGAISTVAGDGTAGGDGGPATIATLNSPGGVAVSAAGDVYITDTDNARVRKVSLAGTISTVAGIGEHGCGNEGQHATRTALAYPLGVAVDPAGNLYIGDSNCVRVRKVSPGGRASTVAGGGIGGLGDGGPATSARLGLVGGVAVDTAGNLYIADQGNNRVRKVSPTGTISTVAGNGTGGFSGDGGPATNAAINQPTGVAVDSAGNLYIADLGNNRVRRVSPTGTISTVAGTGTGGFSGDSGPATSAAINQPAGVAVDSAGNLYIADLGNNRVRRVSPTGTISTVAGNGTGGFSGDGGPPTDASLDRPTGVAVDTAGNLYIVDRRNDRLRKVTAA